MKATTSTNNNNSKAIRTNIQISGITLEVFRLPNGEYVMSQTQVAEAVGKQEISVRRFLTAKQREGNQSKSYRSDTITFNSTTGNRGGNGKINIMSIDLASEFWTIQSFKGNTKAQALVYACMKEALKRRCDLAFGKMQTTEDYERESIKDRESWKKSREFLKDAHASFTNCCEAQGFHHAKAHDAITLAVVGKTAQELRLDDTVDGMPRVGLNHIANPDDLAKIAQVKLLFAKYRSGGVDQRVKRAIKELTM